MQSSIIKKSRRRPIVLVIVLQKYNHLHIMEVPLITVDSRLAPRHIMLKWASNPHQSSCHSICMALWNWTIHGNEAAKHAKLKLHSRFKLTASPVELMTPEWPTAEHFNISVHWCLLSADNGNDGELGRCQAVDLWPVGVVALSKTALKKLASDQECTVNKKTVLMLSFP